MKLHELRPNEGTTKNRKRLGRGTASGQGKTAGRGQDGQWSRSGGGVKPGFEGGQMPIMRRFPKRGFSNSPFKVEYAIVNVDVLNRFDNDTEVTPELLVREGIVKDVKDGIKILGNGALEKKLTVKAHLFSKSAIEKITASGGRTEVM